MNTRMRRNRTDQWLRDMVAENTLSVKDLIWPLFICEGDNKTEDIDSLPGVSRGSIDVIVERCIQARDAGIPAVALFPVVPRDLKDDEGTEAHNEDNLICRTVRAIKENVEGLGVITDVALDPYTSHGHDGVFEGGKILNDPTVEILCAQSLVQAKAGVDVIAPSDMMDGRIAAIRETLDEHGYQDVKIMSYAAKYASAYYGPFRDAVDTGGLLKGDKKTYQMNPANKYEALREVGLDIEEGADMFIVKPGLPYLDVIHAVKEAYQVPVMAYNVSGEYAMLKAAAQNGWLDYDAVTMEKMIAFKRAGADGILTYAAMEVAEMLAST